MSPSIILPAGVDPPSLPPVKRQAPIFDPAPHRNRFQPACPELPAGLLNEVIATAVAFGMPRREAEEARTNPYVRMGVAQLACLVWDAAAGDKPARAALDRIRFAFGERENVGEILAATEQPANAEELTVLLGGD